MEEEKENINPDVDSKEIILTNEQKLIILKEWEKDVENPPAISDLVKLVFPDIEKKYQDGRSHWGKVIRKFLVEKSLSAKTKTEYEIKKDIELSKEQKDYIINNCQTMKPLEMAKELYHNPRLSPASREAKAVVKFISTLDPKILYGGEVPEIDYKPPKRISHAIARIKKYISSTSDWNENKLSPTQKKNCEMLINYLHDVRFKRQIDSYEKTEDKITFESTFIKYTYDKVDLSQEELDQYISLCSFVVMEFNIKSHIEMLQNQIEVAYDEDNRVPMVLVEALQSAREDLDKCSKRQQNLYNALTEKRSEKISKEIKEKASLLNLVNLWKQETSRKEMIRLAEERKQKLKEEINRLSTMDDLKIKLMGIDENEILYGP